MPDLQKYRDREFSDGAEVVYIPWEDTPFGNEPKPEGYDDLYAEFGLGPLVRENDNV